MDYREKENILNRLEEKAGDYQELYGNCAQGALLALQEQFNLGDRQTLKAATAMPGIALRGETCGAVIGAMMALGMALGREKPEDYEGFQKALSVSRKLCRRFEAELGSSLCREVQHKLFGRSFDLVNPEDLREFIATGASQKCRVPSGRAARIAGEIILDRGMS